MNAWYSYEKLRIHPPPRPRSVLPLSSFSEIYYLLTIYSCRVFNSILREYREKYGAGEAYVIEDVVPDDLQQKVDDVIAGTAVEG